MQKFYKGDRVRLPKYGDAIGVVAAVRGRSNPEYEGDSGYVRVIEPAAHLKVGDNLFVWASDVVADMLPAEGFGGHAVPGGLD